MKDIFPYAQSTFISGYAALGGRTPRGGDDAAHRHKHRVNEDTVTKIAAVGYFGWGNFGDQLFLDTVVRRRAQLWPGSRSLLRMTRKDLATHALGEPLGALLRFAHTVRIARDADVLAYCGGSVFSRVTGVDSLRRRLRPRRVQALGVSVGPFSDDHSARDVSNYLNTFERVVFRDESWRQLPRLAHSQSVEQGGDLAALSPLIRQVPQEGRRGLVVCPSSAADGDIEILTGQVLQAHRALLARGGHSRILALALNSHPRLGDGALVRSVAARLRGHGLDVEVTDFRHLGLQATVETLQTAEMVVSQRLHGAIVAYLSGGRFLIVDHHQKCRAFVEDITNSADLCVRVDAVDVSAALEVALDPAHSFSRSSSDYIERALRIYLGRAAHA